MEEFLEKWFSSDFMPHGHCYLWNPGLVWLHVVSDGLIALAYFSIPLTLIYFIRQRRDLPFHWIFVSFGIFILACGATHTLEVWTLWHANYWLSGTIKAATAMVSVATAIMLVQAVPQALTLPSPEAMSLEIAQRKRTEQALQEAKNELERKVLARTAELRRTNEHLLAEIAQRQRADEALRRNEAYFSEAQKLSHTGSWAYPASSGLFTGELRGEPSTDAYWSEENFRIWGFDPQPSPPDLDTMWRRVHPEDLDRAQKGFQSAIRARTDFENEFRLVLPDGTVRCIQVFGHPVFTPSGELIEVVGTNVDVSERKRAEDERERLRLLEAELAHVNRLSMLGELGASLAHELLQPIYAAVTYADTGLVWLKREQPNIAEAYQAVARIARQGQRAAEIINGLRSFYKKGAPAATRELVDVNEVLSEMLVLVRNQATGQPITMVTELAPKLAKVNAVRVQLQQVFMNLMLNGIEAMKETGGVLSVKSKLDDTRVLISVSDTGIGLPPENADQIFNVFFTTKPHGSGMGLTISRSIIESHGGRLWVAPNDGRGVTFHFTLPTAGEEVTTPPQKT